MQLQCKLSDSFGYHSPKREIVVGLAALKASFIRAPDKNPLPEPFCQKRSFLSSGCKSKKIAACQNPTAKLKGFWQVFVLLDHLRRQHIFNGPGDPRLATYTGALQLSIGGFPALNVLRTPADHNASHAPSGFLRHHGHGEV